MQVKLFVDNVLKQLEVDVLNFAYICCEGVIELIFVKSQLPCSEAFQCSHSLIRVKSLFWCQTSIRLGSEIMIAIEPVNDTVCNT